MALATGSNYHRSCHSPATVTGDQETLDDRISKLPDSLIVQILSLLPTEEAIRTSILCKRWKYVWTSVYSFDFKKADKKNFRSFVDYVLAHSICSKIEKFKIEVRDYYDISKWLNFAIERKVEDVVVYSYDLYTSIPDFFCKYSSLITLDLICCEFPSIISWKSLKSIKLVGVPLSDFNIVMLLSSCPELENMKLKRVRCFNRLEINSLKLKRLCLEDLLVEESESLLMELFAPHLKHLEVSGDLEHVEFRLLDVSSLINANLTFTITCYNTCNVSDDDGEEDGGQKCHQSYINLVQDTLQKSSGATELTLGSWFIEVMFILQLKGGLIPKLNCKYLTLELHIEEFNLYGVAGIMRALSHVEMLNIDISKNSGEFSCEFVLRCLAEGDNIDFQSCISSFEFPNLKNVKIVISSRVCFTRCTDFLTFSRGFDKLCKLSEFVLKNATILERFLTSKSRKCRVCSMKCLYPFLSQMAERLLYCPRASRNCVIIFEE